MNITTPPSAQPIISSLADFDRHSGSLLERALFNHRRLVLLICLLVTALLGWQTTHLQLNASFEKMIPDDHPYIVNYLENRKQLSGLGNAVRIAVENKSARSTMRTTWSNCESSMTRCTCCRVSIGLI